MTLATLEHRVPGLIEREHTLTVPLNRGDSTDGRTIELFARELADPDGTDRPLLVSFRGGPGFEAKRIAGAPPGPGWVARALRDFRVLMLDQRGTGRSTPVGSVALAGMTAEQQAEYLAHFRADAIVDDAETLRAALGIERWSVLGQSFGGFCVVCYLSRAPSGLREALVCAGLPPLGPDRIDDVFRHTYRRVTQRTDRHYARYPEDRARVARLRALAEAGELSGADGALLTWRQLREVGQWLAMSDGSQRLHHLLELDPRSPAFRHDARGVIAHDRNPLYALMFEPCYADGGATRWSAERTLPDEYTAESSCLLTGEHVYPWMFEDYPALRPFREAAHLLADRDWPSLYDPEVLRANEVPTAAAIYADDMLVERTFSEETASTIGALRPWLTSEYDHDGLRASGQRVLDRLLDLARGRL